jgi:hypothetical protein
MHVDDHFDDDFLIRLLHDPAELQRSGREPHLNACESCRDQLELYRRVQSFLQREPDFEVPPEWVTRMVRTFEAEERRKSINTSSRIFGWLVFDSLLADPAGVRAQPRASTERHLIFESSRCRVDLLIESADPDHAVLIGQLLERQPGQGRLTGTTVEVMVGKNVFNGEVDSTGEFIVPVGRLSRGDSIEMQFQFEDVVSVIVLIPT